MAKDSRDYTPSKWSVGNAVQYLTHLWPLDQAADELVKALVAKRLVMECRQTRGGEWGEVTPSFWRDHLTIAIVDGQARVIPLKALSPGNYEYRLSEVAVRRAFARQPPTDTAPAISSATWIENAVEERRAAGKTYPNITALSVELSKAMEVDPQANPLKPRTIENRLREWGLWPLQGAQARTNGPVRTPAR